MRRDTTAWGIKLGDGEPLLSGGVVGWQLFSSKGAATIYLRDYRKDAPAYMKDATVVSVRLSLAEIR